jgi:tetratricopeptide (TPR) repeat protein
MKQAALILSQAEEVAASIKDADGQCWTLAGIAACHARDGKMEQAEKLFAQARETAATVEAAEDRSRALARIAVKYDEAGYKRQAAQLFFRALETANSIVDGAKRSSALADIAGEHAELGQMEEASELLAKAIGAARTIEDESSRELSVELIAILYGSAWSLPPIREAARSFEYPDWMSFSLMQTADEVSQMKSADEETLLEITHAIRPLSEFWETLGQPALSPGLQPNN